MTRRLWLGPTGCQARRVSFEGSRSTRGPRAVGHTSGPPTCGPSSGTGLEHRGVVVPTSGVGNTARERIPGRTRRWHLTRLPEMTQDPPDHRSLLDERDQAQAATTPRTGQHVEAERASSRSAFARARSSASMRRFARSSSPRASGCRRRRSGGTDRSRSGRRTTKRRSRAIGTSRSSSRCIRGNDGQEWPFGRARHDF